MLNKLSHRNEIIACAIVIFFFITIRTTVARHSRKIKKIKLQEEQLKGKKAFLDKWEAIDKSFQELKKDIPFSDAVSFKGFVEESAAKQKIDINYLHTSQTEKDFYREVTIILKFSSLYENFANFIKSLEEKNIEIETLNVKNSADNADLNEVEIALKVIIADRK